jgi:hypothetical protein
LRQTALIYTHRSGIPTESGNEPNVVPPGKLAKIIKSSLNEPVQIGGFCVETYGSRKTQETIHHFVEPLDFLQRNVA